MKRIKGIRDGLVLCGALLLLQDGLQQFQPQSYAMRRPQIWVGWLMLICALATIIKEIGETHRGQAFYRWLRG